LVTVFSQIAYFIFYDAPSGNLLTVVTIASVITIPHPMLLNESFGGVNAPQYGGDVPGDGAGFGSDSTGFGGATSLILDFSQEVAAFGATFVHNQNTADDRSFVFPVTILVFSGLDGEGTLLGTVTDSAGGITLRGRAFVDFRGLWSTDLNIRSAVISSTSAPMGGFQVDGYAVSTTPIPELRTIVLITSGIVLLGIGKRSGQRMTAHESPVLRCCRKSGQRWPLHS
jgi:hypothetical protein